MIKPALFLRRLKFYSIGIGLGIIIVLVFFGDREISCAYFPNQRVLKKITSNTVFFPAESCLSDTTGLLKSLATQGRVDFGKSKINRDEEDQAKTQYSVTLEQSNRTLGLVIEVENDSTNRILEINCQAKP